MPLERIDTGIDLYYEVHGEGEPVVFIPGTGFSGNVWDMHQVPGLSGRMKVITFDQRGCGRSSAPDAYYSIEQMACDVAALLDRLGIRSAHILGHSMGGRIALAFAMTYPGRTRSLILCAAGSGPAARSGDECVPGLPYRMIRDLMEMGFEKYVAWEFFDTTTYFTTDFLKKEPAKVKAVYDLAWRLHAKLHPFLRLIIARHTWEGTHRLSDITCPTLVVFGDNDDVGSNHVKQAVALSDRIRGSETKVLKGQSHGFFWQAPEETNAWIAEWVHRHAAGA